MEGIVLQVPVVGGPWEEFALLFITALAGGAFGAALGALPAFVFTGFLVFLGEGLAILQRGIAADLGPITAVDVTGVIGFGAITGPHVAFAGGVAASAYVGKQYPEMRPEGPGYHFGKNITTAFGTKPDILAVGAVFGVVGMLITQVADGLFINVLGTTPPTDFIAFSVVATALLARLAFSYPLVGEPQGSGYLDMSLFERDAPHPKAKSGREHRGRPATEPWLAHQYEWPGVTAIGVVGGLLGGYIWLQTGSVFLGYAISAMSLLFLNLGVEKIPVTHHITLVGAAGAVVVDPIAGSVVALLAAGAFGAASGLIGEVTQRVFYAHSGTHVDPPAMAIAVSMFIVGILWFLGVLPNAGYL